VRRERPPKLLDRAKHGLLDGVRTDLQNVRDAFDCHAFEMPQNERGPFAFREPGERRRHVAVDLAGERPAIGERIVGRNRFDRIALLVIRAPQSDAMRAAAAEKIDGAVDADPVDPCAEAGARIEAVVAPVRLQEGLLDHVLRVLDVAGHAPGEPEDHPAVLFDQSAKGIGVRSFGREHADSSHRLRQTKTRAKG
jgi:hypothetical protein